MMKKKDYIRNGGQMCPFCSGGSLQGGSIHVDDGRAFQQVSCLECERIWQDVYRLMDAKPDDDPVYIIANPSHHLGFMVVSHDDPLGYRDPAEAVSELGQMRRDCGEHLNLYAVTPVDGPVASRSQVDRLNRENRVEDFDHSTVEEYLDPELCRGRSRWGLLEEP